jgi:uncharacterized protein YaiE (UPF0345 family)
MSTFDNVTVTKSANVYFDGAVVSHAVQFADGTKKTLGIMQVGDYEFSTGAAEIMEMLRGPVEVQLAGSANWTLIQAGESFDVPANSSFKIKVPQVTDYCCSYIS